MIVANRLEAAIHFAKLVIHFVILKIILTPHSHQREMNPKGLGPIQINAILKKGK